MESLVLDAQNDTSWNRLKEIFVNPSLQMVSFTITEKGSNLKDGKGEYLSVVAEDFENGPQSPVSYIGQVASLVYERYLYGKQPLALVSMDNMSRNGTKLYKAVSTFAKKWVERDLVDEGFKAYISDPINIFSMVYD